ncbi:hypothetical protein BO78DRAFT_429430, partial [Aspergillus sclerotiicarbonarius CBS 121057]
MHFMKFVVLASLGMATAMPLLEIRKSTDDVSLREIIERQSTDDVPPKDKIKRQSTDDVPPKDKIKRQSTDDVPPKDKIKRQSTDDKSDHVCKYTISRTRVAAKSVVTEEVASLTVDDLLPFPWVDESPISAISYDACNELPLDRQLCYEPRQPDLDLIHDLTPPPSLQMNTLEDSSPESHGYGKSEDLHIPTHRRSHGDTPFRHDNDVESRTTQHIVKGQPFYTNASGFSLSHGMLLSYTRFLDSHSRHTATDCLEKLATGDGSIVRSWRLDLVHAAKKQEDVQPTLLSFRRLFDTCYKEYFRQVAPKLELFDEILRDVIESPVWEDKSPQICLIFATVALGIALAEESERVDPEKAKLSKEDAFAIALSQAQMFYLQEPSIEILFALLTMTLFAWHTHDSIVSRLLSESMRVAKSLGITAGTWKPPRLPVKPEQVENALWLIYSMEKPLSTFQRYGSIIDDRFFYIDMSPNDVRSPETSCLFSQFQYAQLCSQMCGDLFSKQGQCLPSDKLLEKLKIYHTLLERWIEEATTIYQQSPSPISPHQPSK